MKFKYSNVNKEQVTFEILNVLILNTMHLRTKEKYMSFIVIKKEEQNYLVLLFIFFHCCYFCLHIVKEFY